MGGERLCLGDIFTKQRCRRHTKRKGQPACAPKICETCGVVQRCKAHCKCQGVATGRSAARTTEPQQRVSTSSSSSASGPSPSASSRAVSAASSGAAAAALLPPPVGRPAALSLQVYTDGRWLDSAKSEIAAARSSVVLATYMMNCPGLCGALKAWLKRCANAQCQIIVDRQNHDLRTCPGQLTALRELQAAGAEVHLCYGKSGTKGLGYMHVKALIIDRRLAYYGGANFTKNASNSWELVSRITGPETQQMLEYILSLKEKRGTIIMSD